MKRAKGTKQLRLEARKEYKRKKGYFANMRISLVEKFTSSEPKKTAE